VQSPTTVTRSARVVELDLDSVLIEGSNCREIIDNVVDMAHFFYIHYGFPTYFKNIFEGHIASQFLKTKGRPDVTNMGLAGATTPCSTPKPTTSDRPT